MMAQKPSQVHSKRNDGKGLKSVAAYKDVKLSDGTWHPLHPDNVHRGNWCQRMRNIATAADIDIEPGPAMDLFGPRPSQSWLVRLGGGWPS